MSKYTEEDLKALEWCEQMGACLNFSPGTEKPYTISIYASCRHIHCDAKAASLAEAVCSAKDSIIARLEQEAKNAKAVYENVVQGCNERILEAKAEAEVATGRLAKAYKEEWE